MSNELALYVSSGNPGTRGLIKVRAHVFAPPTEVPPILRELGALLKAGARDMSDLKQRFPGDISVLIALDHLLDHSDVQDASDICWSSEWGHSIHISLRVVRFK